jgi:hypothetical protein
MTALDDVMIPHAAARGPVLFRLGNGWTAGVLVGWPKHSGNANVTQCGRHYRVPKSRIVLPTEEL